MTDPNYPTESPNEIIPDPKVRQWVYRIIALLALVLSGLNAGFGVAVAAGAVGDFPLWLAITNVVFPIFAAGLGYTAQRNTPVSH